MENFETKFKSILQTGSFNHFLFFSDGKLNSEDGFTFNIHRMHLVKFSDYFLALFNWDKNMERREFTIPGISGECLCEILCYIYTGKISVTEGNIADLLVATDYLLLTDLYQFLRRSVKKFLTVENSLSIFSVAQNLNDEYISRQSFRFIQIQFEFIVHNRSSGLVKLPADVLRTILSNYSIYVRSESTVWRVIVEWIQENFVERIKYTPHFLSLLARKELDDKLATEILQHDVIRGNAFLDDVSNMRKSECSNNLEVVQSFSLDGDAMDYRIPPELHVVILKSTAAVSSSLYITYDENLDLWRKIGEVEFYPISAITFGCNIFVFGTDKCLKFDLTTNQCFLLRNLRTTIKNISVVCVGRRICVMGECFSNYCGEYYCEMYNPDRDLWFRGPFKLNISHALSAAIAEKIYVIGYNVNRDEMKAQVFDVETWQWDELPVPNFHREFVRLYSDPPFSLVAHRQYLYLIGGGWDVWNIPGKVEIFDTSSNVWREIADIHHVYQRISAVVWNDQIVVFDRKVDWDESKTVVCWNEEHNSWEAFDKSSGIDLRTQLICTIRDVDSVLNVTRLSRNLQYDFEKSIFISEI